MLQRPASLAANRMLGVRALSHVTLRDLSEYFVYISNRIGTNLLFKFNFK